MESLFETDQPTDTGSSFEPYGLAMFDMGYQSNQSAPDWFDVLRPTKLTSDKNEFGKDDVRVQFPYKYNFSNR